MRHDAEMNPSEYVAWWEESFAHLPWNAHAKCMPPEPGCVINVTVSHGVQRRIRIIDEEIARSKT